MCLKNVSTIVRSYFCATSNRYSFVNNLKEIILKLTYLVIFQTFGTLQYYLYGYFSWQVKVYRLVSVLISEMTSLHEQRV